ncbi:alpha/beta fold hydrolase [Nitratireductor kimnyeongensis]|uniref:Palmitoyl-protein thioesterase ABHD10, mitochondrial n=1 Tax=Nitratireductor kimnyeongensis TaxID=430679 RepID=A0ABW0TBT1_9HYPH|nr:alpha/beta hydrolase [Nitratireductor kimnyeongensis]QZZ37153.1 alpha/beta hydrolase [Nitratireductor kimnyeongensis]
MSGAKARFLTISDTQIAYRQRAGSAPGLVWLAGYKSDMLGTKAEALDAWAAERGHAFLRHDYSGHGESGGAFKDGTISFWLEQSLGVFRAFTEGPQILVGSSMGAWIALRMAQELNRAGEGARLAGLLLLAPAPDFTSELVEPKLTAANRRQLEDMGYMEEPSDYSDEPYIYTRALFEDGKRNRVLDGILDTHCPVHILQGKADPDVPFTHAMRLTEHLPADDVTLSLIGDGDHRLSRPQDIALILRSLEGLIERSV